MATLYVYKQFIELMGNSGFHLTFSENPPEDCTLTEAVCLGKFEIDAITTNDSKDEAP